MKLFMAVAVSAMRRCEYVSWTLQGSRRSCHRYYRLSAFSHCFLPFSLPLGWRCAAAVLARRVNRRIDHDGISAAVGALVCSSAALRRKFPARHTRWAAGKLQYFSPF